MNENEVKKCTHCNGVVNKRKRLSCVVCHSTFHPECVEIDVPSYRKIEDLGDKVLWMCKTCNEKRKNNINYIYSGNDYFNIQNPINNLQKIIDRLSENNFQMDKKLDTVIQANERLANIVLSLESKIMHQTPYASQPAYHSQFHDKPVKKYDTEIRNKTNQSELLRGRNKYLEDKSITNDIHYKDKEEELLKEELVEIKNDNIEISTKKKMRYEYSPDRIRDKTNKSPLLRDRNKFLEDASNTSKYKHYTRKENSLKEELDDIRNDNLGIATKKKLTYEYIPDPIMFRNREKNSSLKSGSLQKVVRGRSRTTSPSLTSLRGSAKASRSLSGLLGINKLWKFLGGGPKQRGSSDECNTFFGRTYSEPNVSGRGTPRPGQKVNRDTFAKQCLERHNKFRATHQLQPLKLSSEMSAFAQDWADHLASVQTMTHRTKNRYGENLWAFMTTDPNHQVHGGDAVDSWYKDELDKYTFGTEPKDLKAGHLTQVLWAGSERLGVGVSKSGNYTFVVCNYDPPGNYKGEYADNVPPIGGWKDKEKRKQVASSSDSLEGFIKDSLRIHNEYRAKHGAPPMSLDANISKYAQEWADQLAHNNSFKHRPNNIYGENLFWSSGKASAKIMCDGWYNEEVGYDYTVDPVKDKGTLKSGHFTQLVWKESKLLGIGRAFTKSGEMIGVANYSPRGNIVGQFTSSVLPPIKRR